MYRLTDCACRAPVLLAAGALSLGAPGCEGWQGTYTGTVSRTVQSCTVPTGAVPGTATVTIGAPNPNGSFSVALNAPGSPNCLLLLQGYDHDAADIREARECQDGAAPPGFIAAGGSLEDDEELILLIRWTHPDEPACIVADTWTLVAQ